MWAESAEMVPPENDTTEARHPSTGSLTGRIQSARQVGQRLGDAIILMMSAQRYRHVSLSDLDWLVLPPLLANQLIVAEMPMNAAQPTPVPVGVTLWARVSRDVETKIRQQIAAGMFPVRLKPEDWTSGDNIWLIDIVAPNREIGTRLFQEFQKIGFGASTVQVHPVVARSIDIARIKSAG